MKNEASSSVGALFRWEQALRKTPTKKIGASWLRLNLANAYPHSFIVFIAASASARDLYSPIILWLAPDGLVVITLQAPGFPFMLLSNMM
jgi:hypothetical protein